MLIFRYDFFLKKAFVRYFNQFMINFQSVSMNIWFFSFYSKSIHNGGKGEGVRGKKINWKKYFFFTKEMFSTRLKSV